MAAATVSFYCTYCVLQRLKRKRKNQDRFWYCKVLCTTKFKFADSQYSDIGSSMGPFYRYVNISDTSFYIGVVCSELDLFDKKDVKAMSIEEYLKYKRVGVEATAGESKDVKLVKINRKKFV